MADELKVNRGLESKIKLQNIDSGSIWITEDGQNLYLDSKDGTKRIHITDIVDITNINDKSSIKYFPNKIYIDGYKLKTYDNIAGSLNTISDLESEILEPTVDFTIDENDSSTATFVISDSSVPKKGTIVIDKNGDVGVVTNVNNSIVTVKIISTNSTNNILSGNDIYFDSNYIGKQVGNINHPYNNWNDLYFDCETLLTSSALTTIHLKSNSDLQINRIPSDINNIVINGTGSQTISFRYGELMQRWNNVTFNQINIRLFGNTSETSLVYCLNCNRIYFKSCLIQTIGLYDCKQIYFDNCNDVRSIKIYNQSQDIYINDVTISDNLNIGSSNRLVQIRNSYINTLTTNNGVEPNINTLRIINSLIANDMDITGIKNVTFIGGGILSKNKCNITADYINISTFDLNGITPNLIGNIATSTGLSSEQIYDKTTDRGYGVPDNTSLSAHLDKIGESIANLNNNSSSNTGGDDSNSSNNTPLVSNAFINVGVFTSQDELTSAFKIGSIMTYVNNASHTIQFIHNLIGKDYKSKLDYDYSTINYMGDVNFVSDLPINADVNDAYRVLYNDDNSNSGEHFKFDGQQWVILNKDEYREYKFSLENASYYAKAGGTVNLIAQGDFIFNYDNIIYKTDYIVGTIYDVSNDIITVRIKLEELSNQIKNNIEFTDNDELQLETTVNDIIANHLSTTLTASSLTQAIKLNYKDRLVKLSNGWDKLCNTTNNYNSITEDDDSVKKLEYYGESNIEISDSELFTFIANSPTTATVSRNLNNNMFHMEENLVIPYKCIINNQEMTVNRIDSNAFINCNHLTKVSIPNTITFIGENAFYGCDNLTIGCRKGSITDTYAKDNRISVVYDKLSTYDSLDDKVITGTYVGTGDSNEKTFIFDSKPKFMYIYQTDHAVDNVILASATYIGGTNVIMISNGSDATGTHNRYLGNVIENENTVTFTNVADLNRTYSYAWIAILK